MLYIIRDFSDNFFNLLKEDPIRPHLSHQKRIGKNRNIFVDKELQTANAITCVSYQSCIPQSENELFEEIDNPDKAIFYTIWSYRAGKGRSLLLDTVNYIREHNTNIDRFITLSPKTEMARRFHLSNGAVVLRENNETINYEYIISS